jgi:hypothetical protein
MNSSWVYHFTFQNLTQNFTRLWLTVFTVRGISRTRDYDAISYGIAAEQYIGRARIWHTAEENGRVMLHYPPAHHQSDPLNSIDIPLGRADRVEVTATFDFVSRWIEGIVFEWSISNPSNPQMEEQAYPHFLLVAVIFCWITLRNFRQRVEQAGTIMNLVLYFVASFCFGSDALIFHVVEQLMVAHLRAFLFYLIAYLANKHRAVLTQIGFAFVFVSFALDLGIAWHSWKTRVHIMHGHDIGVHMMLACVIGSIVGAMSRSVEDRFSFTVYAILLAVNLIVTLTAHDLCIVLPHFEHYIEPRLLFYGTHAIILTVLVYFHQGVRRSESDGDKLNGTSSDLASESTL